MRTRSGRDLKIALDGLLPQGGRYIGALALLAACLVWSYWAGLIHIWQLWQRSDEYSSGLLVPFLAIYVLWARRKQLQAVPVRPSLWLGLAALLASQTVRFFGLFFMYSSAERLSLVLTMAALVLMILGWRFFLKTATILFFLLLMLPWPNRVQAALTLPLQRWATTSAVFLLEIPGYNVFREGNIIHIDGTMVAVAEACNGLRMVTAFFVISGLIALSVNRPLWQKAVVVLASLPIALLCNTLRLVVTSIAFTKLEGDYWEQIFHDFGGYAMMPFAVAAVVALLALMAGLTMPPQDKKRIVITRPK